MVFLRCHRFSSWNCPNLKSLCDSMLWLKAKACSSVLMRSCQRLSASQMMSHLGLHQCVATIAKLHSALVMKLVGHLVCCLIVQAQASLHQSSCQICAEHFMLDVKLLLSCSRLNSEQSGLVLFAYQSHVCLPRVYDWTYLSACLAFSLFFDH